MGSAERILVILGSPRTGGNSEAVAHRYLEGIGAPAASVDWLRVRGLSITPCDACGACQVSGVCPKQDDMAAVYARMDQADRILLVSPVYFNSITGALKVLVDRCQVYWARRFVLKRSPGERKRQGVLLLSAGIAQTHESLCGSWKVADYFFKAQGIAFLGTFCLDCTDSDPEQERARKLDACGRWGSSHQPSEL